MLSVVAGGFLDIVARQPDDVDRSRHVDHIDVTPCSEKSLAIKINPFFVAHGWACPPFMETVPDNLDNDIELAKLKIKHIW